MTVAVIVQARQTSTRLPGKVLLDLAGRTVLSRVLERCKAIPGVDVVCCAVPEGSDHDNVAAEASRCGALVYRGPTEDVLARYYLAANEIGADIVMRVTSDCPMIDPHIGGLVLRKVLSGEAEYAADNMPATWPHGLDCEAFTMSVLERAYREAQDPYEREHVTPYIRLSNDISKANVAMPDGQNMAHHRWVLDTPLDFEFLKAMFSRLPKGEEGWDYVVPLAIVEDSPELAAMNRNQEEARDTRVCID